MDPMLAVGIRHTISGDQGELPAARTVECPPRDRSVDLGECDACGHFGGIAVSAHGAGAIRCNARRARPSGYTSSDDEVRSVMTREVWCATPDVPMARLVELLAERNVSGVPVVDASGHPYGVVSRADLLGALRTGATAESLAAPLAFTVDEHAPIAQAAALMAIEGVHRVPVVDAEGRVVGIVSALDVARFVARQAGYCR